jgi:tartrate-resistant acid phosphatase type 5
MKNVLLLFLLFAFSCNKHDDSVNTNSNPNTNSVDKPLEFFVLGDWGREGGAGQMAVAGQMNAWAANQNPDFIITTGDNFYETGVSTVNDPQWIKSYQNVYNGDNIKEKTWFASLGNHDYETNPDAEVAYTMTYPRWQMPSHYYEKIIDLADSGKVRFIFIDTSPFERSYYSSSFAKNVMRQDTARQKKWLDSLTALNDVDWKIVVGHHHIYTGGLRKQDPNSVRAALEPVFVKNKVDVYFSGHEHDLQHLKVAAKPTHYFVSGAGSDIRPTGLIAESLFAQSILGFMSVSITKGAFDVKIISYKGDVIYQYEIKK